jgi:GT2 family glycosyltransferase
VLYVYGRALYVELNGFDENCFMYSDDIDLSYRSSLVGRTNFYYPETTVIHFIESTVKDGIYMQRFQEAMNFFRSILKKFLYFLFFFMQIGIVLFSFLKKIQGKARPKSASKNLAHLL